jgi:hypothetical protein
VVSNDGATPEAEALKKLCSSHGEGLSAVRVTSRRIETTFCCALRLAGVTA